jgi:hypothetical protein
MIYAHSLDFDSKCSNRMDSTFLIVALLLIGTAISPGLRLLTTRAALVSLSFRRRLVPLTIPTIPKQVCWSIKNSTTHTAPTLKGIKKFYVSHKNKDVLHKKKECNIQMKIETSQTPEKDQLLNLSYTPETGKQKLTFTIPIKPRFPVQSYIFQKLYQGWA